MDKLHKCKHGSIHGHLSSRNVFLDKIVKDDKIKYVIKLGDLGDISVRQSAKVFNKYDIRNTWSSPEVLTDPDLAFNSGNPVIDIYSYGMLLWELFSNVIPFADNVDAANKFVVEKNFRPKITYQANESSQSESGDSHTDVIPEEIAEIIKKCWAKDQNERPQSFADVFESLKLISYDH